VLCFFAFLFFCFFSFVFILILYFLYDIDNNNNKTMQQIKQSTINYIHNTDWGDKRNKINGKGKKVQGAWCTVHDGD